MSARKKVVKVRRSAVAASKKSSRKKYTPPKLPNRPPVTHGPKSYGKTKSGKYIVIRFFITNMRYKRRPSEKWRVIDFAEGCAALGTDPEGYSRSEAIRIARKFRDRYGSWARSIF